MPIYEYQCEACGNKHEALQKISDPLLTRCPECGAESLKKLVSSVAFRLSGSGWYETDFKKKDEQRNVAGGSAETSEGSSKDSGNQSGSDSNTTGSAKSGSGGESGTTQTSSKQTASSAKTQDKAD